MAPARINFRDAFDRWDRVSKAERKDVEARTGALVSREALDHLCGLSVEVGLKYLMIHRRGVAADPDGDYPAPRPHIDELWDVFMAKMSGRANAQLLADLGGARQPALFQTWQTRHRYAPDGTVTEAVTKPRMAFLKKLRGVIAQEDVG